MIYLGNAFSLQMLSLNEVITVTIIPISDKALKDIVLAVNDGHITNCIGHTDLANIIGLKSNRISVHLNRGDILYVLQVVGGRLPEGTTTLPDGITLKLVRVDIN